MGTYMLTISRSELEMLINATQCTAIKYARPEMTEAARKAAKDYNELCSKLYYTMLEQDDANSKEE